MTSATHPPVSILRERKSQCHRRETTDDTAQHIYGEQTPTPRLCKGKRLLRESRKCGEAATKPNRRCKPYRLRPSKTVAPSTEEAEDETANDVHNKRCPMARWGIDAQPHRITQHTPHATTDENTHPIHKNRSQCRILYLIQQTRPPTDSGKTTMVGPRGFEPLTFCTPSKRATRLRYGPKEHGWQCIKIRPSRQVTTEKVVGWKS